jgi:hypothetical protein
MKLLLIFAGAALRPLAVREWAVQTGMAPRL